MRDALTGTAVVHAYERVALPGWRHGGSCPMDQLGEADVGHIQPDTHSFIIKVWLSEQRREGGRVGWHGRIIHVPSGHRHHFSKMKDVAVFITPYLHQLGVRPTVGWKVRQWLRGRP